MIVGETIKLSRTESQDVAWTATSAAVTVTGPDGTTTTPSVTVTPSGAAVAQTLSFLLTPTLGGAYRYRWHYSDPSGETIYRADQGFATWTDAAGTIRTRLQRDSVALPDSLIEPELAMTARKLLARYPVIGNGLDTTATAGVYNLLAGDDQYWFDEAAALMVCARLVGPLNTGGGASDIIAWREGDEQQRFVDTGRDRAIALGAAGDPGAGPGGYAGQSERQRWLREAAEAVGRIGFVRQQVSAAAASFNPFLASGPTRTAKVSGRTPTLMGDIIRLLTDDDFGSDAGSDQ